MLLYFSRPVPSSSVGHLLDSNYLNYPRKGAVSTCCGFIQLMGAMIPVRMTMMMMMMVMMMMMMVMMMLMMMAPFILNNDK